MGADQPPRRRSRPERLAALAWFEAAGRCGSFGAAARELGTSQPAVSQRVAALEAEIGTALFERRPGGAALTPEGVRLHAAVSEGLASIDAAVAAARGRGGRGSTLTIATDFGFATYWLAPRLDALREAAGGGVEVRVLAAQRGTAALEAGADLGVLFLPEGAATGTSRCSRRSSCRWPRPPRPRRRRREACRWSTSWAGRRRRCGWAGPTSCRRRPGPGRSAGGTSASTPTRW
jgi:DNA-binding transcriptional LysR family regulator